MQTYPTGSPTIAYLAMGIPLLVTLLLWLSIFLRASSYRRRFQGWRLAWEMWISTALLSVVLVGAFYWFLFVHPFYAVTVSPNGVWTLSYMLPERDVDFVANEVASVRVETVRLPIYLSTRPLRYAVIELTDGTTFTSAYVLGDNDILLPVAPL